MSEPAPRRPAPARPDPRMDVFARPHTLVRITRRRRLNVRVSGEGSPTVLLFGGGASGVFQAARVQSRVGRFTRVVSFDRAGSGFSDPGPLPRTASRLVADLRAALGVLNIGPPYVVVGHSQGSFDCRLFTFLHRSEVAGIVLVDPRGDRVFEAITQAIPALAAPILANQRRLHRNAALTRRGLTPGSADYQAIVPPHSPELTPAMNQAMLEEYLRPGYWRCNASEQLSLLNGVSQGEVDRARVHLGDMPLILLAARRQDRGEFSAAQNDAEWAARARLRDDMASLSDRGVVRHVDCGHDIPRERPGAVAEAIREIVDQTRS